MIEEKKKPSGCLQAIIVLLIVGVVLFGLIVGVCGVSILSSR